MILSLTTGHIITTFDVYASYVMMMAQHFLLSAQARTLSLSRVFRLSESEAYETFKQIRWANNGGEPVCPRCGCAEAYEDRPRHAAGPGGFRRFAPAGAFG
jgi:hypothetical protein